MVVLCQIGQDMKNKERIKKMVFSENGDLSERDEVRNEKLK